MVHRDCVLKMSNEQYLIDLVHIPLCGNKATVGMDWLSPNGTVINCECQMVRVRTPSREELVVHGKGAQCGPILCSAARAR